MYVASYLLTVLVEIPLSNIKRLIFPTKKPQEINSNFIGKEKLKCDNGYNIKQE